MVITITIVLLLLLLLLVLPLLLLLLLLHDYYRCHYYYGLLLLFQPLAISPGSFQTRVRLFDLPFTEAGRGLEGLEGGLWGLKRIPGPQTRIFFSIIPMLPRHTTVVYIFFCIIPILPYCLYRILACLTMCWCVLGKHVAYCGGPGTVASYDVR